MAEAKAAIEKEVEGGTVKCLLQGDFNTDPDTVTCNTVRRHDLGLVSAYGPDGAGTVLPLPVTWHGG